MFLYTRHGFRGGGLRGADLEGARIRRAPLVRSLCITIKKGRSRFGLIFDTVGAPMFNIFCIRACI